MIAKALVDMHGIGAEISAYSAGAGEGCRFTLRIPLISLEPVPDTPKNRSNISPSFQDSCFLRKGYEEMGIPPDFMGRRQQSCTTEFDHDIENSTAMETDNIQHLPLVQLQILVVDDSKLNRRMLSKLLQSSSHICDEASDGLEAVMMFKDRLRNVSESEEGDVLMYDAILMDFMMPNMDGPTATREIRELGFEGLILGITGEN